MLTNVAKAGPVIRVSDLEAGVKFFESIGFETTFKWGDPPFYAVMVLSDNENYGLHLHRQDNVSPDGVGLYFISDDVDEIYARVQELGHSIIDPIADQPYGMRDFTMAGPDDIPVSVGKEIR